MTALKHPLFYLLTFSLMSGCATMTPTDSVGADYTYEIQQKNATTYYLKYTPGPFDFVFYTERNVLPKWIAKAKQLCGGDDFYHTKTSKYLGMDGFKTLSTESPHVYGTIYCNTKFQDSREQKPDSDFAHLQNLMLDDLKLGDISPLWGLLEQQAFTELDETLLNLEQAYTAGEISEQDFSILLGTFDRHIPEMMPILDKWVKHSPKSYFALYARSLNQIQQAWFHRGHGYRNFVTEEGWKHFYQLNDLAISDIKKGLALKPVFFPLHATHINVTISCHSRNNTLWKAAYQDAINAGAATLSVKSAYLRGLQPRWLGSLEDMRQFIDQETAVDPENSALEIHYLLEEARVLESNKALEKYQQILDITPNATAHTAIASIYRQQSKLMDAKQHLELAIQADPYFGHAYSQLANLLIEQNDYVGALAISHGLLAFDSKDRVNYLRLGALHYTMRRYDDALISYQQADSLKSTPYTQHRIRSTEYQQTIRLPLETSPATDTTPSI